MTENRAALHEDGPSEPLSCFKIIYRARIPDRSCIHQHTTITASDVKSWNQHEFHSRARLNFSRKPSSAVTMLRQTLALESVLAVGNVVSTLGLLARWTQNTTSQNLSSGMRENFTLIRARKCLSPKSRSAGRHPYDQAGKLSPEDLMKICSCVDYHRLPRSSSHRNNIISFSSGCLLFKALPQTILTHTFFCCHMSPSIRWSPALPRESSLERQGLGPLLQEFVVHGFCSPFLNSGVLQTSGKCFRQHFNRLASVHVPFFRIRIVCFVSPSTAVLMSSCNAKEPHHRPILSPASDRELHVSREVGHCHLNRRSHVQTNSTKVAAQQPAFPRDVPGSHVQTCFATRQ